MSSLASTNVLLLGSGGREHALAAAIKKSAHTNKLYCAPGNGGIGELAELVDIDPTDALAVCNFAQTHDVGLVVIGPEAPLVAGVADALRKCGIHVFGPNKAAARLEGSKSFAKEIMEKAGVPTATYKSFSDKEAAIAYVGETKQACVVKADGLAAGKGVFVCSDYKDAVSAVDEAFDNFGSAGETVVIEELLEGPECSVLTLTDGQYVLPLAASQDHKRAYDGDLGPNTGGMGVYSPVPVVDEKLMQQMLDAMQKVVDEMVRQNTPYTGCLYGGFMLTEDGPKVLEFNARFGDPETQVVLPRMEGDLVELMNATDTGKLANCKIAWKDEVAVSVVLASAGYPGAYEINKPITGITKAEQEFGVRVYHAGTKINSLGQLVTSGGRVLNVTALADTFEDAREKAYAACNLIDFEGKMYRKDIAQRAITK